MLDGALGSVAYIEAPYAEVWASFTQAERYAAWHSSPCLAFGDAPGAPVVWGTPERTVYRGEVVEVQPGQGLIHTFQFVGFGFEEPPTPVRIEIQQAGPVVLVRVEHDCRGAPQTAAMITSVGWAKSISRLKTLLETGEAMPWPE